MSDDDGTKRKQSEQGERADASRDGIASGLVWKGWMSEWKEEFNSRE